MIAIAGGKGGSGKTTTALGIGRTLARQGGDPIVVDCDCDMPDLHHHAGIDRDDGIDRLANGVPIERACTTGTTLPGVRILTAGHRSNVEAALNRLAEWHGSVILDCPPGIGPDAVRPLRQATAVILVSTDQPQSIADTKRTAVSARELEATVHGLVVRTVGRERNISWADPSPILTRTDSVEEPLRSTRVQAVWFRLWDRIGRLRSDHRAGGRS